MTDLQIIAIAFFVVGLVAYFFGEALPITLLLGWLTWQWINDQPDRALAMVQAGLVWSGTYALYRVMDAALLLHRRLTWRRMVKEIEQVRSEFTRAGLNWDYEMDKARLRHNKREQMYRNAGLSNRSDRESYFSEKGDY